MEKYIYKTIDLETTGFRLVRLLKGSDPAEIYCELFQAYLQDPEYIIPYEALSYTWGTNYTWGDNFQPYKITIDGNVLPITANLHLALRYLRYVDEDRILWVDAICIDQGNHKERGHQVNQMRNIYKNADRVLVWLGQSTEEIDLFMDGIKALERASVTYKCKDWSVTDERWGMLWKSVPQSFSEKSRRGLELVLDNPWFKRVWILQEIVYARSAVIICGTKNIPAQFLPLAPKFVGILPSAAVQSVLDVMPGSSRRESWWSKERDLLTLLCKFGHTEASDPRDKIFALFGISSEPQLDEYLTPDYSLTTGEVIVRTSEYLSRCKGRVNSRRIERVHQFLDFFAPLNAYSRQVKDFNLKSKPIPMPIETLAELYTSLFREVTTSTTSDLKDYRNNILLTTLEAMTDKAKFLYHRPVPMMDDCLIGLVSGFTESEQRSFIAPEHNDNPLDIKILTETLYHLMEIAEILIDVDGERPQITYEIIINFINSLSSIRLWNSWLPGGPVEELYVTEQTLNQFIEGTGSTELIQTFKSTSFKRLTGLHFLLRQRTMDFVMTRDLISKLATYLDLYGWSLLLERYKERVKATAGIIVSIRESSPRNLGRIVFYLLSNASSIVLTDQLVFEVTKTLHHEAFATLLRRKRPRAVVVSPGVIKAISTEVAEVQKMIMVFLRESRIHHHLIINRDALKQIKMSFGEPAILWFQDDDCTLGYGTQRTGFRCNICTLEGLSRIY